MSREETKGKAKQVSGKIHEDEGKTTGDTREELKGKLKQIEGKIQEGAGKIRRKIKEEDQRADRA